MIGEIYLAGAFAIFIAISGWGDVLFGLSKSIKELESVFIKRANLSYDKYLELKNLLHSKVTNSVSFTKKLFQIIKGSKIKSTDTIIINLIKENEKSIENGKVLFKLKKCLFFFLFIYLFFVGSYVLYTDYILLKALNGIDVIIYSHLIIFFQIILFILMLIGVLLFVLNNKEEGKIKESLNQLILRV